MRTTATTAGEAAAPVTLWRCGGRQCGAGECEHDEQALHRHASEAGPQYAPPIVHDVLRSSGDPLPVAVRGTMENRLGHDFADVRIHTDAAAADSARRVGADAYTVGSRIVFGQGRFAPGTTEGNHVLAHELAHVLQQRPVHSAVPSSLRVSDPTDPAEQTAESVAEAVCSRSRHVFGTGTEAPSLMRTRCHLVPAATCSAPIAGSAEEFSAAEATKEVNPRARRARMSPARQRASGHTGRARQLELVLEAAEPGLLANVHGIFIDQDMSSGTAALVDRCGNMVPPVPAPPGAMCVFVPGQLNQEAFRFRQGRSSVGGQSREEWRIGTLQTLVHEIQHVVFDAAGLGQPAGVAPAACARADVEFELSELAAIMSEFPTVFRAVPAGASAADPARVRLADWFDFAITNSGESIRGALTTMRCTCDCGEVDSFVAQTFGFVTSSWTPAEKSAFNIELRKPAWSLHWPL